MKKEERFISFYEAYLDDFFDSLEDTKKYLKNDKEYKKCYEKINNILKNNKKIEQLLDEQTLEKGLTKEECKALIKVINLYYKLQSLEEKEIYFKGGMDAYFYFKKLGILR